MRAPPNPVERQRGAALLLVLLLVLIAFSYGLLQRLSATDLSIDRSARTSAALAEAKQALITHALVYGEGHKTNATPAGSTVKDDVTLPPGSLPCPDKGGQSPEGSETVHCGDTFESVIGRLPWRSLGISPLRDGSGECLWYAVSGNYKANPSPHTLNPDSLGQFRVLDDSGNVLAGSTASNRAVAVIIAPGTPIDGQNRSPVAGTAECGGNFSAAAYLDAITLNGTTYNNALPDTSPSGISTFVTGSREGFKDRIIYITREEIWGPIQRRRDFASALFDPADDGIVTDDDDDGTSGQIALAQKIAAMLARYGKHNKYSRNYSLPWPTKLAVSNFHSNAFFDENKIYAGRPPYRAGFSRIQTDNELLESCSGILPNCRLLVTSRAGPVAWWKVAGKPLADDGAYNHSSFDGWWDKWKDHYFYVVSREFSPDTDDDDWEDDANPCDDKENDCVQVNGKYFAAAVIFAGNALPTQTRATLAERLNHLNYLEGLNATAFSDPSSNNQRTLTTSDPTSNDRIVCIRPQDLAIDSTCTQGSEIKAD